MSKNIDINSYNYHLPDEKIAKYPLPDRSSSKLLIYRKGEISERQFFNLEEELPSDALLVFNNTRVIRARIIMHKPTGGRVEIFALEPYEPADYERSLSSVGVCRWRAIVGNLKKWKEGAVTIQYRVDNQEDTLEAYLIERGENNHIVEFRWGADISFGELLTLLGRIPIPPYLNRESEEGDLTQYQTVYSKIEGSVAAPTAGLHFTPEVIESLRNRGITTQEVTLHVGAGTFLPVKVDNATQHTMHTEHFSIELQTLKTLLSKVGVTIAVGTTSVRTLESLTVLAYRIKMCGSPNLDMAVGQWEVYDIPTDFKAQEILSTLINYMSANGLTSIKAATQIMITPLGFSF
ncbi:MAG: S-adenosylmethionine:tRNA ribosyltransferase-isomerase, partial [Rikenellaceae bacterium]